MLHLLHHEVVGGVPEDIGSPVLYLWRLHVAGFLLFYSSSLVLVQAQMAKWMKIAGAGQIYTILCGYQLTLSTH